MMMHAHFTAMQWKSSHLQHPNLPGPNNYEWKWDLNRETFDPIMTTNPPAPESIIEWTACGCDTGCKLDRCRCRKSKFVRKCADVKTVKIQKMTIMSLINLSGTDVDDDWFILKFTFILISSRVCYLACYIFFIS